MRSKQSRSRRGLARRKLQRSTLAARRESGLQVESLECRQLLAGDDVLVDPMPAELEEGRVSGYKWQDTNGDGVWNDDEAGLGGVTIYFDANQNRRHDRDEPYTITNDDGSYELLLEAGQEGVIREVVPSGYVQTYPNGSDWDEPFPDGENRVDPPMIEVPFVQPGDAYDLGVSITIEPVCIRPHEIDVVSSDPSVVTIENQSGVQLNGCGGETSHFEITIMAEASVPAFEILFVDGDSVLGSIPVILQDIPPGGFEDGHFVVVDPGLSLDGLNFGNQPIDVESGGVSGRVWNDANGNGEQDGREAGMPGVTVYADLNQNGVFDRREPSTITERDIPETDFDEAGLYNLSGLPDGEIQIRQIVPRNYRQTSPGASGDVIASQTAPMNPGVAFDMALTAAGVSEDEDGTSTGTVDITVTWPDSCGTLIEEATSHVVVGNHLVVELSGHQVGDACAEVISPQTTTVNVGSIEPGDYHVVAVLNEDLRDGQTDVPTLTTVGEIVLGTAGYHVVSIQDGGFVDGVNFGNQSTLRPGSISGTKWLDENGNGQRDDGEVGLGGVTIYLDMNFNGVMDPNEPSTVTQEEDDTTRFEEVGRYRFDDVEPGVYSVAEVVPEGYYQTFPNWGWDIEPWLVDGWREDFVVDETGQLLPPPGRASTHVVHVESGQAVDGIDFGNQVAVPGSISGMKWLDVDGNGAQGENEPGLGGVTIYLDLNFDGQLSDAEPSTVTAEDGSYSFADLEPGRYAINEVVPEGFRQTYPLDVFWPEFDPDIGIPWFPESQHYVWLEPGQQLEGLDFGNQELVPGSISGTKWLDANGNSQRDEGESGVAGVTIYLDLNYNAEFDADEPSVVTASDNPDTPEIDETGTYRFDDVAIGSYSVREVVPEGFVQTFPSPFILWADGVWGPEGQLIEPRLPIDEGHYVSVGSGANLEGIDFGNQELAPSSISGTKWLDANGNGTREADEPGVGGVTIYLDLNGNQTLDEDEPTQRTADDGSYRFDDLTPGWYVVDEVVPEGYEQTFPSDIHWPIIEPWLVDDFWLPPFGGGHSFWLGNGSQVEGIDFGNRPLPEPALVAGSVWFDSDMDGSRSDDEAGMEGIVVYADANGNGYRDASEPFTTTLADNPDTEANEAGDYQLAVRPGTYEIRQELPFGLMQTFPAPTGTDVIRQDVELLPEGRALEFSIVGIEYGPAQPGLGITVQVTWPDGCGAIDVDDSFGSLADDGSVIEFQIAGYQASDVCTLALETEVFTLWIDNAVPMDWIQLQGSLVESLSNGELVLSAFVHAEVGLNRVDGHQVTVASGDAVTGLDFGNSEEILPPGPTEETADLDGNGTVDPRDIDALAAAIRNPGLEDRSAHDLTGDGLLDDRDLKYLVENLLQTQFGDADMNGHFDSSDLVKVFALGEYEDDTEQNSHWESGDWNGDGEFDSSDLVIAFQSGKYEAE